MTQQRLAKVLGYSGLVPFIFFSSLNWLDYTFVKDPHYYLMTYAAIILSFMGAIHWGVAMSVESDRKNYQLGISVIPPLLAWLALLLPEIYGYSILIISFSLLCLLDKAQNKRGVFPEWYYPMRVILTTVVVLCLIISSLALVLH
jgi:hypothetical protein